MARFTLEPQQWCTCMMFGDGFDAAADGGLSPTPIRVDEVKPLA